MNIQIIKTLYLLCFVFLFPHIGLSQKSLPQIELAWVSQNTFLSEEKGILRYGVEKFDTTYIDSLVNYIDTICDIGNKDKSATVIYKAVWGNDTLTYRNHPHIIRTYTYDPKEKRKRDVLEVESQIPPFSRFSVVIEGLDETTISALTDSMLRMKSPTPILLNNYQTCIFYALDALFRSNRINPDPIITRNTTFEHVEELKAFFNHFLTITNIYQCRYKELKDKTFPENSILALLDDYGNIIHAVFYQNGLFHTKNGMSAPIVLSTIKPVLETYGRWDTKHPNLSKTGKRMQGNSLTVYTLNRELFMSPKNAP